MGEMDTFEALRKARDLGLDLVEVAPNANPPVCRIMDYSRFLYEEKKKEKKAKKHQQTGMKEMVFHPKIDTNDYNVKLKKIKQFFKSVPRVKIEIRMRGRERMYPELAENLAKRIIEDTSEYAEVTGEIKKDERSVVFHLLQKKKRKVKDAKTEK